MNAQHIKLMEKASEVLYERLRSLQESHFIADQLDSLIEERVRLANKLKNIEKEIEIAGETLRLKRRIFEYHGVDLVKAEKDLEEYEAERQSEDLQL
jgi:hypothetical protein